MSRAPEILADAAYAIFNRRRETTGNFFIDEDVLRRRHCRLFRPTRLMRRCASGRFFCPRRSVQRSPTKVTKAFG